MDHTPPCTSQAPSTPLATTRVAPLLLKKVQVVYYLSYRGGLLEQPHLLEVSLSSSRGLCLKDVKARLASLRGRTMASSFSWSYKRSYKEGFVWQDLESDNDLIFPTHSGSEYVMKGCRIESSPSSTSSSKILASPLRISNDSREIVGGISTSMQPAVRMTQMSKAMDLAAIHEHVNNDMVGSPSNASHLHGCDDNITFNLGVIEGLEQLHLLKAIDLHHDYAESQGSTSLSNRYNAAMEQNRKYVQKLRLSKELSVSKLHLNESIRDANQYGSPVFSVVKKTEGMSGSPFDTIPCAGADAATQTGEDDESPHSADRHGNGETLCFPDLCRAEKLPCTRSREASSLNHKVSLHGVLMELSREEISPPPCSTSSSSTTASAHSVSNSNTASRASIDALQKCSINQSSCLAEEDQNLQGIELSLSPRVHSDKEALLKEEAMAAKSTLDGNGQGQKTPSSSADFEETPLNAIDHLGRNLKSDLNSSKIKPHVMGICSNSGKFLHLISCGRGVEVIDPSYTRSIQRSSSMNRICRNNCEEVSGNMQYSSLLNGKPDGMSCLDAFPPNENAECERIGMNLKSSHLPIAANNAPASLHSNVDGRLFACSSQDSNSGLKKSWHWRDWFHSHHKKRRSSNSKNISMNSAGDDENAHRCLDLLENHVMDSGVGGFEIEESSSECRLMRVRSAHCPSISHQH